MNHTILKSTTVCALALAALSFSPAARALTIDTVYVGDLGNAADTVTPNPGYGSVGYGYSLGTTEVTLNQYTAFLNAVAATDTYNLYNTNMGTNLNIKGIVRAGVSGSYSYSVFSGSGLHPVTYVSWFDAARFSNWLQNGQPSGAQGAGTTETGAYTLSGSTSGIIAANPEATWRLPTEDEWYKAAYYDPIKGGTGGYWLYATRSSSTPGNVVGGVANQANYNTVGYSVTQSGTYSSSQNYLTNVGAFTGSASAYGTYDQDGNAFEWNDADISSSRGVRGGSWISFVVLSNGLPSGYRNSGHDPAFESRDIGFRVATVPEPSTVVSLIVGMGVLAWMRKRPF